jgi:membrane-bound lytic murein transglycosylase B
MKPFKQYFRGQFWLGILSLCLVLLISASYSVQASYRNQKIVREFVEEIVLEEGFDRSELLELFGKAEKKQSIIDAMSRPAEKTKSWYQYRKIFVTTQRADQGVDFYNKYLETLDRAEEQYGVPKEIIVSIMGVETRYGSNKGNFRVIDALSTLAFDYPKRSSFFRKELKHFLILAKEQQLNPEQLLGSYAGAMGFGQFMPSSYRAYAVDFDGDGKVDIWNNPVDAIVSVANYFKRHGWSYGSAVTGHARVEKDYRKAWVNDGLKPKRTLTEFEQGKIYPVEKFDMASKATAMRFEGQRGTEYWLGLDNFYVITRYNHSAMYAMSVYQLAQEIASRVND